MRQILHRLGAETSFSPQDSLLVRYSQGEKGQKAIERQLGETGSQAYILCKKSTQQRVFGRGQSNRVESRLEDTLTEEQLKGLRTSMEKPGEEFKEHTTDSIKEKEEQKDITKNVSISLAEYSENLRKITEASCLQDERNYLQASLKKKEEELNKERQEKEKERQEKEKERQEKEKEMQEKWELKKKVSQLEAELKIKELIALNAEEWSSKVKYMEQVIRKMEELLKSKNATEKVYLQFPLLNVGNRSLQEEAIFLPYNSLQYLQLA
eukprot:TRINITY_DN407_c0_g1_i2.p1 TRINITY_DN407_c0_g1~~TRINITY_DN407_c0_g1_i2.p1  ORF type:complete len:267 (+),score=38.30 TRINITY_DN407_c0_g1_i2:451-1251(+)